MKIKGIGIVNKKEIIKELGLDRDKEGREALRAGMFTDVEIGGMYKLLPVNKSCKIGSCGDTFAANFKRIPEDLKEELTPAQLGSLVDAFYQCYGDGKSNR